MDDTTLIDVAKPTLGSRRPSTNIGYSISMSFRRQQCTFDVSLPVLFRMELVVGHESRYVCTGTRARLQSMPRFSGDLFDKDGATNMTHTEHCQHRGAGVDTSAGIERRRQMIDGTSVLLRPIEPGDFELERNFADSLSRSTRYMRLMSGRWPSDDEIYRWTHIDRQCEGALIATISVDGREQQIGVARYVVDLGKSEAELAIVISDAWHGKGLGICLLSSLIDLAKQSGVRWLFGTTLSENNAKIGLGRRLGFMLSYETGAEVITKLSLDLHSRD